jgi:hypothetical protein
MCAPQFASARPSVYTHGYPTPLYRAVARLLVRSDACSASCAASLVFAIPHSGTNSRRSNNSLLNLQQHLRSPQRQSTSPLSSRTRRPHAHTLHAAARPFSSTTRRTTVPHAHVAHPVPALQGSRLGNGRDARHALRGPDPVAPRPARHRAARRAERARALGRVARPRRPRRSVCRGRGRRASPRPRRRRRSPRRAAAPRVQKRGHARRRGLSSATCCSSRLSVAGFLQTLGYKPCDPSYQEHTRRLTIGQTFDAVDSCRARLDIHLVHDM